MYYFVLCASHTLLERSLRALLFELIRAIIANSVFLPCVQLFDLAVNQMFQEWVDESHRGRIAGAQAGAQYLMDCVHYGVVFIWPEPCLYGHGIILTTGLMFLGYGNLILHAICSSSFGRSPEKIDLENDEKKSIFNVSTEMLPDKEPSL